MKKFFFLYILLTSLSLPFLNAKIQEQSFYLPSSHLVVSGVVAASKEASLGQRVYRVWGQNPDTPDLFPQQSGPWGKSWTRVDPRTALGYRNAAGLPDDANLGRFISEGRLIDTAGVTTRDALRIGDNLGGLDEVLIPNPSKQIILDRVFGVNPQF